MCIAVCGIAAGALLWRDRGPAGQPAVASARAAARPVEPDRPTLAALAPRPSLASRVEARPARVPAGVPDGDPVRAPGIAPDTQVPGAGDDIAVTRALVRASLAEDIPRKLPGLTLSAGELDRLSDTVLRVREHRSRLRGLAHTRDNAAEIRRLEAELVHELMVIEEVTGMSATELTGALSDEGLTTEEQAHAAKPVYWTLPE